ncbi:DUF7742 family protein [Fuscibacter oryzae]|uniref:DUF7742 domain-containing protein n=1 Tax=Fuscibacter oryzae TaxID=2803939 RepID=A0A8J7MSE0_9RHOB|nr:hypothetical protein [Fuscibacter oryzae]MBL4927548.1 hypothetical protein [Fuscibacter oryzae]
MRRALIGDLLAAARVLSAQPPHLRAGVMDRLIDQAHAAHRYMARFGRPHLLWGDGSLLARALAEPAVANPGGDICDFAALSVAAARLAAFRRRGLLCPSGQNGRTGLC